MTWSFDSHIHLSDSTYLPEINFILTQMKFLKIKACCVSMNVKNSLETLSLSKQSNLVLPFIGIHPECA
ncbi:MAG: TatD family hydrolase, partial [Nitrosopumilus sp.]|nr:TatD family hydrolase [Nitrosopumilus sp.]